MDCEKLKDFLNSHDHFCKINHIQLKTVEPGRSEAVLTVTPDILNGNQVVQGGAMMTLADFAFAGAANALGKSIVSQSFNYHFLRPGTGATITATAKIIHNGKKCVLCQVEIRNDADLLVGTAEVTGFVVSDTPIIS